MATKNFVPRATGQGQIGTTSKKWLNHNAISGSFTHVSASVIQVTSLLGDISGSTSSTGSFGRLEAIIGPFFELDGDGDIMPL